MRSADVLADAFGRIREVVHDAVDGLSADDLAFRVDPEANSIAWLVWHLTRVQDDHVAGVAGTDQVWLADGWAERFALPFAGTSIGFGHRAEDVAAVTADGDLLLGYHDAVCERTIEYVSGLRDADLDEVIDESWDPPVTRGVRLVSVIGDDLQHAGQAAFVKGVVLRRS
ncbi:uncharacterized protein DUF664 [Prauserella shujinwangii]|uniref:Uncharacterized protein DUF664 n=1 Tax=Prauserella shujinwangii TaxID=1453103 RepID=A0A2T0LQ30_9PSEU|nr:DUF664 domain-containing protein [Prauserella shujinwangii]PRX45410.1 uncharacterized protein DUF664 [Prauserella shujinwangii]